MMEKALEILKKEYPLICDMSFEWGWKSCEETMKPKTCEGCKHLDKDTLNSEGNGEYTRGFCVLFGLSKNERPFKHCNEFEAKDTQC